MPAPLNDDTCMEAAEDLVQDSAETPPSCDNCDSSSPVNSANELSETVKSGRSVDMMVDVPFVCMSHVGVSSKKDEPTDQKSVGNPQPTIDKYEYDTNDADAKMRKNKLSFSREQRECIRFMNVQYREKEEFYFVRKKINERPVFIHLIQ